MNKIKLHTISAVLGVTILYGSDIMAEDARHLADEAVADILFDYDNGLDFATYTVNDDGFVNISFARNMPDELYSEVLDRLKHHPDIDGVLAGKTAPPCRAW